GVLPRGQILGEQCRRGGFGPVLAQTDHLTMHDIRQDGPEPLPLAPLNFIQPNVPWPAFHARAIPLREESLFGAAGFVPAHAMADGCMTGRHRLTVHADLLPQTTGDARLRVRELHALRADATRPTDDRSLRIDERHVMRGRAVSKDIVHLRERVLVT